MKAYDETSLSSSESMTDLKREVNKFKDAEAQSSKYIIELEQRLARSDESVMDLQQTVEKLEKDAERRREEVTTLEARLETFRQDGESWRSDLEAREAKVKALEVKLKEWEEKKKEAGETRLRLGSVVDEVESARRSLEVDLKTKTSLASISPESTTGSSDFTQSPVKLVVESETRATSPAPNMDVEAQLLALQQTHTATLADLSSITSKYRDALHEISDLAAQIQEAQLGNPIVDNTELASSDKFGEQSAHRRRVSNARVGREVDSPIATNGRRLFFRQAASAESLHAR